MLELAGIGPAPFACMVLADLGADVVRVERPGGTDSVLGPEHDILLRGRAQRLVLDARDTAARTELLGQVARADVLVESFRPGVTERLGLGPNDCAAVNPGLIYARMTGWGQTGPRSREAGHDITYLAVTGALSLMGEPGRRPIVPLNLVADFGGGAMPLVVGVLAGLLNRARTGKGCVVDAAMVDGVCQQLAMVQGARQGGSWVDRRASNLLDGGAPFYDTYICSDGEFLAVGALEPRFYAAFLAGLHAELGSEVTTANWPLQYDRPSWPKLRALLAGALLRRSRDQWEQRFDGTDACVAGVRRVDEAICDPHLTARGTWTTTAQAGGGSRIEPAPAPRLSPLT